MKELDKIYKHLRSDVQRLVDDAVKRVEQGVCRAALEQFSNDFYMLTGLDPSAHGLASAMVWYTDGPEMFREGLLLWLKEHWTPRSYQPCAIMR